MARDFPHAAEARPTRQMVGSNAFADLRIEPNCSISTLGGRDEKIGISTHTPRDGVADEN